MGVCVPNLWSSLFQSLESVFSLALHGAWRNQGERLTYPGPDPFGLAGAAENVNAGEVEPSSANTYRRGEALPVACTVPALAKDTAGVEPAGEAEKAAAANFEALIPLAQDKTVRGREVETPPQEGKRTRNPRPEPPPRKGKREVDALLQGNPNKGELKPDSPSQELSREDILSTRQGPSPWDLGGRPLRGHIIELKRACRGRQARRSRHRRPQQNTPGRPKMS